MIEPAEGVLNRNSPTSLRASKSAIIQSIRINIKSISYALYIDSEMIEIAIQEAKRQKYVLSSYDNPSFLRGNIEIIKQSLQADNYSSKYISWSVLSAEEKTELENYIIQNNISIVITFDFLLAFQ